MPKYILTNANIHAFSPIHPQADSIFIEDGVIKAIGTSDEIVSKFDTGAKVQDLDQSILIPSFTDAHIHLLSYGLSLLRVNVETLSKQDCLDRIASHLKNTAPGKWIIGHGWDQNIWPKGYGSKKDLDELSDHHPIYLTHKSLHSGWANSIAFEIAGVNSDSPDPEWGMIQRDASGESTGIVLESAMKMIESAIPMPSSEERESAILEAQTALHQFGITAVHDFDPWSVYESLEELQKKGSLSLRITKGIPESFLEEALEKGFKSGDGNDWLKIGWLKLFADGALGTQTAAMLTPYENSQSTGMLFLSQKEIEAYGEKALTNGIALAVHAIGDRANRETLLAISQLNERGLLKIPVLNSRVEHVQLINNEDIHLFSAHDVVASMQPIHSISDMEMANTFWGKRCGDSYAWKSILKSGAKLIFGSDAPVENPNPLMGLHAAILRKKLGENSRQNPPWIPEQCLDLQNSLKAYITTPSIVGGFENLTGKIKTGYAADLILLPKDFFLTDHYDIEFMLPLASMSGGKWVYKNDNMDIDIY
ncbi:MAG: amidohydrolase [Pelolinea sp.]|nr:amidohydrolase [Pelolinea sp.]